ncbi:MAG: hypothetical protein MRY32_07340 [Rickettsiales bacterium]|nr:hypothetical protein [Rickettsiales bacterium]
MRIKRHFTKQKEHVLSSVAFKRIDIEICNPDPKQSFCVTDFEVPSQWSYAASEFLVRHYVVKNAIPTSLKPVEEEGVPVWLQRHEADKDALLDKQKEERFVSESSAKDVFHRMAGAWTYWGWTLGYFDSEGDAKAFYDECLYALANQIVAPASAQWLNTGLHWAYGIEGKPQGHCYVDAESGKILKSPNAYERPLHHHCFIQNMRGDVSEHDGVMSLMEREAKVFLYGSGAGCNMSSIRSSKESQGFYDQTAGLMRFLSVGDKAAAISTAKTQAEKLVMIDMDHPDIEQFICWKVEEEHKAAAMITGAKQMRKQLCRVVEAIRQSDSETPYDPETNERLKHAIRQARRSMIPESYIARILDYAKQGITDIIFPLYSIGGESDVFMNVGAHHAKLAVRVPDQFLIAAHEQSGWSLTDRIEKNEIEVVDADEILDQLAQASWATGDPSIQFDDTIQFWHGCHQDGRIDASSPQAEFTFLSDTACDIATMNLLAFITEEGEFDCESFEHASRLMTVMLDIAISMAQFPSREIARNTYRYRPIGLSYCNLAAALMRMGYAYDSDEARAIASAVTAIMTGSGYVASAEMAKELGAFEAFSSNREGMMRLLHRHHEAAHGRTQHLGNLHVQPTALDHASMPEQTLSDAVQRIWDKAIIMGDEFGYSNAQISAIAKAPNAARLLDADSLSVMPEFGVVKYAAQAQGKFRKYVPKHITQSLQRLGYKTEQINDIVRYVKGCGSLLDAPFINHEMLRAKGFGVEQLERVEEMLPHAISLQAAFDPFTLGEGFCRDVLGLDDAQMYDANFDVLSHLGFMPHEIEQAGTYACGTMCMQGAPHLRSEDVAIYDGTLTSFDQERFVSVESQIKMMGSIQSFVSGGIAHRIVTPNNAAIHDTRDWLTSAWKAGLKNVSLHRLGCGLHEKLHYMAGDEVDDHGTEFVVTSPRVMAVKLIESMAQKRRELPLRRGGYTQKAIIGNQTVYLRTGEYQDGQLGEIFVDVPKQTAKFRTLINQFAIAVSIGLQYGVPLESFVDAFRSCHFEPSGHVQGNPAIDTASSILDYIFRELSLSYLQSEHEEEAMLSDQVAASVLDWHQINEETISADMAEEPEEETVHIGDFDQPETSVSASELVTEEAEEDDVIIEL